MALAARFAEALDLEPTGASLVVRPVAEPERVRSALDRQHIRAAVRGTASGSRCTSGTTTPDVERAVEAIRPFVREPVQGRN